MKMGKISVEDKNMKVAPPTTPTQKWTFESAIKQLEFCEYKAVGGVLIWNDAFIWLKNTHAKEVSTMQSSLDAVTAERDALKKELDEIKNPKSCANCTVQGCSKIVLGGRCCTKWEGEQRQC